MDKVELFMELRKLDEVTLLEILELTSDDIVDAFVDRIEEYLERCYRKVE